MKILAISNLKGGVGKSTSTMFLSEHIALYLDKRILVLDLDPQANCSAMFLSTKGLTHAHETSSTLLHFFIGLGNSNVRLSSYIRSSASDVVDLKKLRGVARVDLVPSDIGLYFVEHELTKATLNQGRDPDEFLAACLKRQLEAIGASYDLAILDCAPGFSPLTRAALRIADFVVSPTIADEVSVRSLKEFTKRGMGGICPAIQNGRHYVIVPIFSSNWQTKRMLEYIKGEYKFVEPRIGYSVDIIRAAERIRVDSERSLREKYNGSVKDIRRLAERLSEYIF